MLKTKTMMKRKNTKIILEKVDCKGAIAFGFLCLSKIKQK